MRDDIARKRIANDETVDCTGGPRIVDHILEHGITERVRADLPAGQRCREVAPAERFRRDRGQTDEVRRNVAVHLVVEEEKGSIAAVVELGKDDWTTKVGSEIMAAELRPGIRPGGSTRESNGCVELLVREVIVQRSVQLIGAGTSGEVEETTTGLSEFGGLVRCLKRKFF